MRMSFRVAALASLLAACAGADWLQFRTARSNSTLPADALAEKIDGVQAIAWTADLPGRGPSSPIVVGKQVIVTASSGFLQDRLHVLAFDVATGKPRWERQFWATGRTLTHPTSANAAPTPASDGHAIYAFFSSNDMVALDLDGNLLWYRGLAFDSPSAGNDVGMSSSPVVIGGIVIAQVENQGDSFAVGLDSASGKNAWRIERPHAASWSSPVVMHDASGAAPTAVLLQSPSQLTAHDPATGRELWSYHAECEGIPSAVTAHGLVYVPSEGVTCLRPSPGKNTPDIVWRENSLKPGGASLIESAGRLVVISRAGVLIVADAETGRPLAKLRLDDYFWGTPALVGDRLLCAGQKGGVQVIQIGDDGKKPQAVGSVPLGETLQSSPVVADQAIFIRGDHHLWKIAGAAPAR